MAAESATAFPCPILENHSSDVVSVIPHEGLPSDDFNHISAEANAAAAGVLNSVHAATPSHLRRINVERETGIHSRVTSIGILNLEEEDASFDLGLDGEQDFMRLPLESMSESDTFRLDSPTSTHVEDHSLSASSPEFLSSEMCFEASRSGEQSSTPQTPCGESDRDEAVSPIADSPSSVSVKSLTLELQDALRIAELEVSQLHSQVCSKTEHLEMAQRALVDYEDEVQNLRQQIKELTDGLEAESPVDVQDGLKSHTRQLSRDSLFEDLQRVKSGTHRLRQSLGGGSDEAGLHRLQQYQVLKENYERLNVQKRQLEVGIEARKAEVGSLSCELHSALEKSQDYEERNVHLIEENRSLKKEATKLRIQFIQAQDVVASMMEETPDVDKELVTYRQRLKEAQEQREMLHRDLDCAKAELAALRSEMSPSSCGSIKERPFTEKERIEQANEERVLQLREVLNSKLQEHPEMLRTESGMSEGNDHDNMSNAKERICQLQEALALALEAKTLLEERVESKASAPADELKLILEDISELKENFQKERRMALRERTENENLIMALQQERDELIEQMHQITLGLDFLQEETVRVQGELASKRLSSEEYKIKAEMHIRQLELDNASSHRSLTQARQALDLCLEDKHELELRVHQSDKLVSEWIRSVRKSRMQEENFTNLLRHRVDSGNASLIKQAALQAIEHLERLQEETQKRVEWSTTTADIQCSDTPTTPTVLDVDPSNQGDTSRMMTVTANQLRTLRKDLREVTQQRDEALNAIKSQRAIDARRFGEIQELQKELNSALDQYETLLPQFQDVISVKKEMENKVHRLMRETDRQDKQRIEMESAVMDLLNGCHKILKGAGFTASSQRNLSLIDSILWTRTDLDAFYDSLNKKQSLPPVQGQQSSNARTEVSSASRANAVLKPVAEQLRSMVDKERDLRRYFDSQSGKLEKLKVDTEQRSQWVRRRSSGQSVMEDDYPATEMQLQEHSLALKKLSQKEEEIADLLAELGKSQSVDQEMQTLLSGLENFVHSKGDHHHHAMAQNMGDRINRLQECAGSLENQLIAVKGENKQLKAERQFLLQKVQLHS